jgi:hypothetical protein
MGMPASQNLRQKPQGSKALQRKQGMQWGGFFSCLSEYLGAKKLLSTYAKSLKAYRFLSLALR